MPKYELPELPYGYSALEPHLSGEILELHHGKHHQAYVDGANTTFQKLGEARSSGDFGTTTGDALGIEVPIAGVAGDQQAALYGQGCWKA